MAADIVDFKSRLVQRAEKQALEDEPFIDETAIEIMEQMLAGVKAGEITGFIMVGTRSSGDLFSAKSGGSWDEPYTFIGMLADAQHELHQDIAAQRAGDEE